MRLMTRCLTILAAVATMAGALRAQEFSKAGTASGQFLRIPVGAKAVSMGSTFSSVADDISALYWNPAGVSSFERFQVGFTSSRWFADIRHNFLGGVLPLGNRSSLGVSIDQLSSGDIEATTIDRPQGTGTFYNASDLAIGITYARYMIDEVSVGITAKYIQQRIWNTTAQSFAADLGVLMHTRFYGMKLGLSFQNFGPEMAMSGSDLIRTVDQDPNSVSNPVVEASLKTQPFSLPTSFRGSLSMPLIDENGPISLENTRLLLAVDAVHANDSREHYSVGGECGFMNTLFVRGGYVFHSDTEGLTLGGGVNLNLQAAHITFDYAYASFGVLDAVHILSLGLQLQ